MSHERYHMEISYKNIGKIIRSYKLKGDIILYHPAFDHEVIKMLTRFFIEVSQQMFVPYFITQIKVLKPNQSIISVENIHTKEKAIHFLNQNIYVPQNILSSLHIPPSLLHYQLFDQNNKHIGMIHQLITMPHQMTGEIMINHQNVYIPIHKDNTIHINHEKKIIVVSLPEGLLDLYLK